jgi:hypothetical protein
MKPLKMAVWDDSILKAVHTKRAMPIASASEEANGIVLIVFPSGWLVSILYPVIDKVIIETIERHLSCHVNPMGLDSSTLILQGGQE